MFETKYLWYHGSCLCCFCASQGQSHHIMHKENCYALSALLTKICSWSFTQNIQRLGNCTHTALLLHHPLLRDAREDKSKKRHLLSAPREILWHLLLNV